MEEMEVDRPIDFPGKKDLGILYDEQEWAKICGNSRIMSRDLRVRLVMVMIICALS